MEHIVKCKFDLSHGRIGGLPVKGKFYTCTKWEKETKPNGDFHIMITLKEFINMRFDMSSFYTPDIERYADKLEWIENIMSGYEGESMF